jgi:hypothetical protein
MASDSARLLPEPPGVEDDFTEVHFDDLPLATERQVGGLVSFQLAVDTEDVHGSRVYSFDYSWLDFSDERLRGAERNRRQAKGKVWWWAYGVPILVKEYNTKLSMTETATYFICKACYTQRASAYKFNLTRGSSAVQSHFSRTHFRTTEDRTPKLDTRELRGLFDMGDPTQRDIYNKILALMDPEKVRKAMLAWVVYENIPLQAVSSPHFRQMFEFLEPIWTEKDAVPSRHTLRRWITKEHALHKAEVKAILKKAYGKVHLSFDIWTSRRRRAMNGVTAHWVTRKGRY